MFLEPPDPLPEDLTPLAPFLQGPRRVLVAPGLTLREAYEIFMQAVLLASWDRSDLYYAGWAWCPALLDWGGIDVGVN